jgi:hypothetical protein
VSIETVLNVVWAGLWPLFWVLRYDILTAVGAMVLIYAVYRGVRARIPALDAVMQRIEASEETEARTTSEKIPEAQRHTPSTGRH